MIKKQGNWSSVEEIVCCNTGMNYDELMEDRNIYKIHGLNEIRDKIIETVHEQKRINIFADYDVDGQCSGAIFDIGFNACGCSYLVNIRFPRRFSEGYGVSAKAVEEFGDGELLITVDNGISAIEAIQRAKEKGMYVIVIDHHLPQKDDDGNILLPNADLIVDPKAFPDSSDFDGYCGAGLAYRVMCKLVSDRRTRMKMLSLAAIATIADVMPLTHENRRIVKYSLEIMTDMRNVTAGMYALFSACGCNEYINEESIAYKIAPCLNAPGRLIDDGARISYELLIFDGNLRDARALADKQMEYNSERKELSDKWIEKAQQYVANNGLAETAPLVLHIDGIPEGIIGIVAGKMAEQAKAPCIFLAESSKEPNLLKGSARSYGDVHLFNLLKAGEKYLSRFGGHKEAAGLSLAKNNFDKFRECMINAYNEQYPKSEQDETVYYQLEVNGNDTAAVRQLITDIQKFAPYGQGNPSPILLIKDLMLVPGSGQSSHFKYLGDNRAVKLSSILLDCVSFDNIERYERLGAPDRVNIVGKLSKTYYMGNFRDRLEFVEVEESKCYKKKKSSLALMLEKMAKERQQEEFTEHGKREHNK